MSQLSSCIALMKANGGKITCGRLAQFGLYHKAASRLGVEARGKGYEIKFTPGKTWDEGVYKLVSEPKEYHLEPNGQYTFLEAV